MQKTNSSFVAYPRDPKLLGPSRSDRLQSVVDGCRWLKWPFVLGTFIELLSFASIDSAIPPVWVRLPQILMVVAVAITLSIGMRLFLRGCDMPPIYGWLITGLSSFLTAMSPYTARSPGVVAVCSSIPWIVVAVFIIRAYGRELWFSGLKFRWTMSPSEVDSHIAAMRAAEQAEHDPAVLVAQVQKSVEAA